MAKKKTSFFIRILIYLIAFFIGSIIISAVYVSQNEQKIIAEFVKEANKQINAEIKVKNISVSYWKDFPEIAVILNKVEIEGSISNYQYPLLKGDQIRCDFNIWGLINGNYSIKKIICDSVDIHLYINEVGERNFNIAKSEADSTSEKVDFDINEIKFNNISFTYLSEYDKQLVQAHNLTGKGLISIKDKTVRTKLQSTFFADEININEIRIIQKKNLELDANYEFNSQTFDAVISKSWLMVDDSKFDIDGEVQPKKKRYYFNVSNQKAEIGTLINLLPNTISDKLIKYKSKGQVWFSSKILKKTEDKSPSIDVNFGTKNLKLYEPSTKFKITNLNLTGNYSNGRLRNNTTSVISLNNVKGQIGNEIIEGEFKLSNFDEPLIHLKTKGELDLTKLNPLIAGYEIELKSGKSKFNVELNSKLDALKKGEKENINATGEILLDNFQLVGKSKNTWVIENGAMLFNKNTIALSDFNLAVANSDFNFTGMIVNPYSYLIKGERDMYLNIRSSSKTINLDSIIGSFDYKAPKNDDESKKRPDVHLNLQLQANKFIYGNFNLTDLNGQFSYSNPVLNVRQLTFHEAEGTVKMSSTMIMSQNTTKVEANLESHHINIKKAFRLFDNFNQEFITDQNLEGYTGLDLHSEFLLDKNSRVIDTSLTTDAALIIEKGKLVNFEPMNKMAIFIDREELMNIEFETLENTITIKNNTITIPKMDIKSSLTNITLSGTHTFDQKIDYRIAVPIKDFISPDRDASFGAIENSGNKSIVHLKITGTTDNYKIGYDTKAATQQLKENIKKEIKEFKQFILGELKKDSVEQVELEEDEYFDF